ncbi:MAG: hypothetical protein ACI8XO_004448 [Verrucomicrobiales bacterium]|jgi:hypothetical protein
MSVARWTTLAVICVSAGIFGYLVGGPTRHPQPAAAPRSPVDKETARHERTLADLVSPNELSALPESIGELVEQALVLLEGDPFAAFALLQGIESESDHAQAIVALVGQMDAAQLGTLVAAFTTAAENDEVVEDLFRNALAPIAIFERWAELDSDAVVDFVEIPIDSNSGGGSMQMPIILRALSLAFVAQRDPDRAFAAADKLREQLGKLEGAGTNAGMMVDMFIGVGMAISDPVASLRTMRERGASLEAIGEADPIFEMTGPRGAEMLAEVLQYPEGLDRNDILAELYLSWGAYDLSPALASIDGLPDGAEKSALIERAMQGAIVRDPSHAAQYIDSLPEGEARTRMAKNIVEHWSGEAPVEALNWARENLDDDTFVSQLRGAAPVLPVAEAKVFVEQLSDQARAQFFALDGWYESNHFTLRMIREDPRAGFSWLDEQGGMEGLRGETVAQILLEEGLDAAINSADYLPEALSEDYVRSIASEAGRNADTQSIAWAREQGDWAHQAAVGAWAEEDPRAALAYATGQGPELVGQVVSAWSANDPAAAFGWAVETHAGDPEMMLTVLEQSAVIDSWGERDPVAAVDAVSGLPDEVAAPFIGRVVAQWAGEEPARVSEYLAENFPDNGDIRDQAVLSLVNQISRDRPDEARAWAESISDDSLRTTAIESLGE